MKKLSSGLRDTFIAGLIFLLPILIFFVLISKVFGLLKKITTKLADLLGFESVMGIPAHTIIGIVVLMLICFICGYLMRVAFFKHISTWIDNKLRDLVPGYELYHRIALSKLEKQEEQIHAQSPAWLKQEDGLQPAYIMETLPDNRFVVFLPKGGKVREGNIMIVDSEKVELCSEYDHMAFRLAIMNHGLGLSKLYQGKTM
jgi:hypothetical protein